MITFRVSSPDLKVLKKIIARKKNGDVCSSCSELVRDQKTSNRRKSQLKTKGSLRINESVKIRISSAKRRESKKIMRNFLTKCH